MFPPMSTDLAKTLYYDVAEIEQTPEFIVNGDLQAVQFMKLRVEVHIWLAQVAEQNIDWLITSVTVTARSKANVILFFPICLIDQF